MFRKINFGRVSKQYLDGLQSQNFSQAVLRSAADMNKTVKGTFVRGTHFGKKIKKEFRPHFKIVIWVQK